MMNLAPDAAVPALPDLLVRGLLVRETPPGYGEAPLEGTPSGKAPPGPSCNLDPLSLEPCTGDSCPGDSWSGKPRPGETLFTPGGGPVPTGLVSRFSRPPRDPERDDIDVQFGRPEGETRPDWAPVTTPESLGDPPPWVPGWIVEDPRGRAMREMVLHLRRNQLPLVRALAEAHESGQIYDGTGSTMGCFARGLGLSTREAFAGVHAGHLFKVLPETEVLFLEARLSLDHAALLGELHEEEGGLPSDRDWVRMGCELTYRELYEKVDARREERRQGAPVKKVELKTTLKTRRAFARARTIASRKARRPLTRGEAFAHIVQDYLNRHDPMRRIGRKGRRPKRVARCSLVGDYVPRAEKDRCRLRFGDRCAVAGCTNRVFLDFAHIRARALGGANRWWNLLFLCRTHHRMFDGKRMFLVGPAGGEQWFEDRKGRRVADLRAPPPEYLAEYPRRE